MQGTDHVTIGAEAATILQSNLAPWPSAAIWLRGRRTKRGMASLRSVDNSTSKQWKIIEPVHTDIHTERH